MPPQSNSPPVGLGAGKGGRNWACLQANSEPKSCPSPQLHHLLPVPVSREGLSAERRSERKGTSTKLLASLCLASARRAGKVDWSAPHPHFMPPHHRSPGWGTGGAGPGPQGRGGPHFTPIQLTLGKPGTLERNSSLLLASSSLLPLPPCCQPRGWGLHKKFTTGNPSSLRHSKAEHPHVITYLRQVNFLCDQPL